MTRRWGREYLQLCVTIAAAIILAWPTADVAALSNSTATFDTAAIANSSNQTSVTPSRVEVRTYLPLSGLQPWIDPDTPEDRQSYVSSRGELWELVMSDEFSNTARNFTPGGDHMWTSLEKPDGVNGAVEVYSHNMTYIECEESADGDEVCYLAIKVIDEESTIRVYNMYSRPPSFQYSKFCNPDVFDPSNQRISACDSNPGHGLNPNQGRGAPEIDLLEGGGVAISSSIQIGPGLKKKFRKIDVNLNLTGEWGYCFYSSECNTPGANLPNVPTALYKKRGFQTWYKGLRYAGNSFCDVSVEDKQTFEEVNASLTRGILENRCTLRTCPASRDVLADTGYIDGIKKKGHWGINSKGNCFAIVNSYMGSYLCDPDNMDPMCEKPRNKTQAKTNVMEPFAYQMDALSANWGVHVGAYTGFVTYQVEWVMGDTGYVRWMLSGTPIYEIPAQSLVNGPQDAARSNPRLTFPEEPMYIIFNVALSAQWGARPPNVGYPCRGNGTDPYINRICDGFPMYMKIDYVRLYQDLSENSTMAIGCDPKTHPTRQWILDHIKEYEDDDNKVIDVDGGAACRDDDDCTIPLNKTIRFRTGRCIEKRCQCGSEYWSGPRCTTQMEIIIAATGAKQRSYGPPLYAAAVVGGIAIVLTLVIVVVGTLRRQQRDVELQDKLEKYKAERDPALARTKEKTALMSMDYDETELSRFVSPNQTPSAPFQPAAKHA
ncbi:hypothetical protein P43SY_008318 [Pythium insidiosum]|uniref:Beta-glucan synthesis-associated protein n=1 Tax=Pythium insidiosum TaxID=114742 RepID=A0AAD5LYB8_PYTIN|nr:hypothetical protein P43SY_008318 [Pythium insidiosum]